MKNMLAIRVIAAMAMVLFGVGSLGAQVQVRTEAGVVAGTAQRGWKGGDF